MAASALPALAPVAGVVHGAHELGALGGSALAAAHTGAIEGLPLLGGQISGLLTGTAGSVSGVLAELGTASIGVKVVTKLVDKLIQALTGSDESVKKFAVASEKAQLQMSEAAQKVALMAGTLDKLKGKTQGAFAILNAHPESAPLALQAAQTGQRHLKAAMAQLPSGDRMGDDAKPIQQQLSYLKRLENKAKRALKKQGIDPSTITTVDVEAVAVGKNWDEGIATGMGHKAEKEARQVAFALIVTT
jgi:hypothetical protein